MVKMRTIAAVATNLLVFVLIIQLTYSRSIREDLDLVSDGVDEKKQLPMSFLELGGLSATTETCQPVYGFLPCSTNVWGLLFLIVVYEILLSLGGQYVAAGSERFFQITGPGVFGASFFQLLGTFPQIIVILVSTLSGPKEAAQQRTTLGMGLVAGTTVMLLTLIWGTSVVLASYNPTDIVDATNSEYDKKKRLKGRGITTDAETTYTSRIMLISLTPFLILQLEKIVHSSFGKRAIILTALILTVALLIGYMNYQIFQPWIQNRRLEYLANKYAKDKIMQLLTTNGKPDSRKIQQLFAKIDNNKNGSISSAELRVLLLGAKIDDDDELTTERNIENVLATFDITRDGNINRDEFMRGMSELVSNLSDQNPDRIKKDGSKNSQVTNQASKVPFSATSSTWLHIFQAAFLVILGTSILCALAEPLIISVVGFAQAANLSSFSVSYLAIPFAMNYGVAIRSIASARQKTQKSISLTLSAIYGSVYMNNIIGLIVFLTPVFSRDLLSDVSAEVLVVLVICILMTLLTSFKTTFPVWLGYVVLALYPISLALVYLLTNVFGWS